MTDSTPKKSPLYTRTGDRGTTSLVDGSRVPKNSARLEAYGTVDELNSFIGAIYPHFPANPANSPSPESAPSLDADDLALLPVIQSTLFDIGSYLATDPQANPELAARLLPANLSDKTLLLEAAIDRLHAAVPPIRSFILPAGTATACAAHIARTVARRAERRILSLQPVDPSVVRYVNRLSDYLFILARRANAIASIPDTPWLP